MAYRSATYTSPSMNRRHFLTTAIAAVSALAIDPEQLLWTPSKKIFIPSKIIYGEDLTLSFFDEETQGWHQIGLAALRDYRDYLPALAI